MSQPLMSRGEAGATFAYNASAAPGVLCSVDESVGGAITYGPRCAGETTNPAIAFASGTPPALRTPTMLQPLSV